jgi:hypothetical protein
VILTASILRIYITWQDTNVKRPDDDIEMSKHVGVYIICKNTLVIYTVVIIIVYLLVVTKTGKFVINFLFQKFKCVVYLGKLRQT